jgi:hypothetical protein
MDITLDSATMGILDRCLMTGDLHQIFTVTIQSSLNPKPSSTIRNRH